MPPQNGSQPGASPVKNRRTNPDYCGKTFLRNVLYVFNLVFLGHLFNSAALLTQLYLASLSPFSTGPKPILSFFSGAAFLAVGLYVMLNRHSFVSLLGGTMFPVTTYLLIATGALIIVIGCIGCVGACQENRCLLFTYAFFLLLIFLLEAVAGVLAYMYNGVIHEELTRNLNDTMMEKYMFDTTITKAIDDMQQEFLCCGSDSFEDWKSSKWLRTNELEVRRTPDSCCKTQGELCAVRDHPSNINYLGCARRMEQVTKESLILIGGIALGFCFIQVFGIIFSCCLIRKIKEAKYRY